MAIIDTEEETKLLRKKVDSIFDYESLKLPISELRITGNLVLNNPELTSIAGICDWSINIHGTDVILQLKEIATGNPVLAPYEVTLTTSGDTTTYTLHIYFNSTDTIAASTYRAVIVG